jgi:DNA-binding transcriptional regulator YdaS (Cro superfamily)
MKQKPLHPKKVAEKVGGIPNLAKGLKISRPAIYQWDKIPGDRVIDVERITGISRHDLRPDLHPRQTFSVDPAE